MDPKAVEATDEREWELSDEELDATQWRAAKSHGCSPNCSNPFCSGG